MFPRTRATDNMQTEWNGPARMLLFSDTYLSLKHIIKIWQKKSETWRSALQTRKCESVKYVYPGITSCTIQPLTQSVLQRLWIAKYYMGHKSSKILTRPGFPLSDRYLVSNLELWETKHPINLPARLYLHLSVPKQTKWSEWWALSILVTHY